VTAPSPTIRKFVDLAEVFPGDDIRPLLVLMEERLTGDSAWASLAIWLVRTKLDGAARARLRAELDSLDGSRT